MRPTKSTTSVGGTNELVNCKLLCRPCHARKTKLDRYEIDKTRRKLKKAAGLTKKKKKIKNGPMPGTKRSPWKHKIGTGWERR